MNLTGLYVEFSHWRAAHYGPVLLLAPGGESLRQAIGYEAEKQQVIGVFNQLQAHSLKLEAYIGTLHERLGITGGPQLVN